MYLACRKITAVWRFRKCRCVCLGDEKLKEILFKCQQITKHFGPTYALTSVDVVFRRGQIHGLIGENGSGKSTLTSLIAGLNSPTSGEMFLDGKLWKPQNSMVAYKAGVRIIVQEAGTITGVSVADNIFMGDESRFRNGPIINRNKLNVEAAKALENINCEHISPTAPTWTLDFETRKLVEIARAAYGEVKMLIVDETTTALSQTGRNVLYEVMHKMAERGVAVIIISHDLAEIQEHCDVLTVLRDGNLVGQLVRTEFSDNRIKQMMIGRDVNTGYYRTDNNGYSDEVVLRADNITTLQEMQSAESHVRPRGLQ